MVKCLLFLQDAAEEVGKGTAEAFPLLRDVASYAFYHHEQQTPLSKIVQIAGDPARRPFEAKTVKSEKNIEPFMGALGCGFGFPSRQALLAVKGVDDLIAGRTLICSRERLQRLDRLVWYQKCVFKHRKWLPFGCMSITVADSEWSDPWVLYKIEMVFEITVVIPICSLDHQFPILLSVRRKTRNRIGGIYDTCLVYHFRRDKT